MNSLLLSLFGRRIVEDMSSNTLVQQGPFKVKMCPRMICAKVCLKDSSRNSFSEGWQLLNDYLRGNNLRVEVFTNTGPSFQLHKANCIEVGFVLSEKFHFNDIPKPVNRLIKIEEVPASKLGSLKFRGSYSIDSILRRGEELKKWLGFKGLQGQGPIRYLSNEFFLPGLRNNEVQIDVL